MMKEEEEKECFICGKMHNLEDCPLYDDVKKLVIARLQTMPDDMMVSIG